jgi:hypothetical protein
MVSAPVVVGPADPVFGVLRTRGFWKRALAGALIGMACGAAWLLATPKTYKATVAMELSESSPQVNLGGIGPEGDDISIDTDALIVSSDAVLSAVAADSDRSLDEIRDHLVVSARPLTRVMTVTYAAASPDAATRGAQAAATAFLQERERLITEPVRDYLTAVREKEVSVVPPAGEADTTELDANLWSLELRRQAALAKELRLAGPGTILEDARITAAGDRGDLEVPIATGAALGVLVSVGVSLALDRRKRRRAAIVPRTFTAPR